VGPVSALGPRVSCSGQAWVHGLGCTQHFVAAVFKGIFEKGISRNCENASKIHIFKNIASKMMKQISVDFL
jgi:hypothetical protein